MAARPQIVSAGAVVLRKAPKPAVAKGSKKKHSKQDRKHAKGGRPLEVLLVHRPKYDDWSFPKGKLDDHEHATTAAVREVAEETSLDIRLGPPLGTQHYQVRNGRSRLKAVHYWVGHLVGDGDFGRFSPNDEIDEVAWVRLDKARRQLSYEYDVQSLAEAEPLRRRSTPVVVLRHGKARARESWRRDDRERPLTRVGEFQAEQLVPLLGAYGVSRVVSSSSTRCWTTVAPYADVAGVEMEETDLLSEEDATSEVVRSLMADLLAGKRPVVVCTHRPVLPAVFEAMGVAPPALEPGAIAVVHHRKGKVLATEVHTAPHGR